MIAIHNQTAFDEFATLARSPKCGACGMTLASEPCETVEHILGNVRTQRIAWPISYPQLPQPMGARAKRRHRHR